MGVGWDGWWGRLGSRRQVIPFVRIVLIRYESKKRHISQTCLEGLRTSHYHWGGFQTNAFHVVSCMGPIVSVMILHGQQNSL